MGKKRRRSTNISVIPTEDIPGSIQWLVKYINLGRTPGKSYIDPYSNTSKLEVEPAYPKYIYTKTMAIDLITEDIFKEFLGIPESKVLSFEDTKQRSEESVIGKMMLLNQEKKYNEIFNLIFKAYEFIMPVIFQDINGNYWLQYQGREDQDEIPTFIFIGNNTNKPTMKMFTEFFKATGIKKEIDLYQNWFYTRMCLSLMMKGVLDGKDKQVYHLIRVLFADAFITNRHQVRIPILGGIKSTPSELKYTQANTLTEITCAHILDYWHNHNDLHTKLRQCNACGKFEFVQKGKYKFCSVECEDRFNKK